MIIQHVFAKTITPIINAFASQNSTYPATCAIVAQAEGSRCEFVLANDTGAFFSVTVPALSIGEDMFSVVQARDIAMWFRNVTQDVVITRVKSGKLKIADGINRQYLTVIYGDELPERLEGVTVAALAVDDLAALVTETTYATETDNDAAIYKRAVNIQATIDGRFLFQANNGFRGMAAVLEGQTVKENYATLVSRPGLKLLSVTLSALAKLDDAPDSHQIVAIQRVDVDGNKPRTRFSLSILGVNVMFDLLPMAADPNIADTSKLFDFGDVGCAVTAQRTSLIRTLRRIPADNTDAFHRTITLRIEEGVLLASSANTDETKIVEVGVEDFSHKGDPDFFRFKIGLSYLLDALSALPGDSVTMTFYDRARPLEVSSDLALGRHIIGLRI